MSTARWHYTRKLAAILTVLGMVLALFPVAAFAQFKDVGGTLADEIKKAYEAGLVSGYSDGTFRPNANVTRAAFAKMIVLAVEKAKGEELETGSEPFADVRPGQALYEYVVKAYKAGYIRGYPDGTFGYNKAISRMEAAAILQRALGLPLQAENFKDVPDNSGFAKAIGAVAAAGIMVGYGDNFKPAENLSRGQAAAVAYRALEYLVSQQPEEEPYEVVAVEQASDSSLRVKFNKAVEDTSAVQFEVKRDGQAVQVTPEWAQDKTSVELKAQAKLQPGTYTVTVTGLNFAAGKNSGSVTIEGYRVVSVTAVSPNALRVTFNKAIADTSAVKFDVKRDGLAVTLTPAWADDKKSVDLKSAAKLAAGTYTVTVTGPDFEAGKNTGSVAVEDEKVARIELVGDKLILDATNKKVARISYKAFNQYGQEVTGSALTKNITWAASVGDAKDDENDGVITVSNTSDWQVGATVVLTGVDPATGVSTSKTLTVAQSGVLSSFSFGNIIYPKDTTRIYRGKNPAAWIEVSATDENGVAANEAYLETAVRLVASSGVEAEFVTKDGKPVVALNTTGVQAAGKVTLTAVVLAKPELNKTITLDVVDEPYAARVEVGAPTGVIAAGDPEETLVLPLTVYDQFGSQLSTQDVVAAFNKGDIQIVDAGAVDLTLGIASEGDNVGKVVNTADIPADKTGSVTITVVAVKTGATDSVQVQIREPREPAELVLPTDAVTKLTKGATTTIELGFKDQYGAEYKPSSTPLDKFGYKVTVDDTDVVTVTVGGRAVPAEVKDDADLTDLQDIEVTAKEEGTATVTVQLLKDEKEISRVEFTVTVTQASSSLQYSIAAIPALYWDADGDGQDWDWQADDWRSDIIGGPGGSPDSVYAETVKIIAKDSQGNSYAIDPKKIIGYSVNKPEFGIGKASDGTLRVWSDIDWLPADDKDIEGTITVLFNTDDGKVLSLQAPVKISAKERTPEAVYVRNNGTIQKDASGKVTTYALRQLPGSKTVTEFTVDRSQSSQTVGYVVVKDQFGRYWSTGWVRVALANEKGVDVDSDVVNVDPEGKISVDVDKINAGDDDNDGGSFDIVILTDNGKTATVTIKVPAQR